MSVTATESLCVTDGFFHEADCLSVYTCCAQYPVYYSALASLVHENKLCRKHDKLCIYYYILVAFILWLYYYYISPFWL